MSQEEGIQAYVSIVIFAPTERFWPRDELLIDSRRYGKEIHFDERMSVSAASVTHRFSV